MQSILTASLMLSGLLSWDQWGEKRILLAVLAALPLLAVRLLYSLLADFANNSTVSILGGNATVQLCMAIIEEMIATIMFLAAGITAPSIKNMERGSDQMAMNQKPPPEYVQDPSHQQQV